MYRATDSDYQYLEELCDFIGRHARTLKELNLRGIVKTDTLFELLAGIEDLDLTDASNAISLVADSQPDEIYNLAAQSFVEVSFKQPSTTLQINGLGTLHLLEAIQIDF